MPKRRYFKPTEEEKIELEMIRDKHVKAYIREKAGALLKIAAGQSPHQVALEGLLKKRDPDTIYGWLERYENEGVEGLLVRDGRGRKPAFSPRA
jgi:transposase